MDGKSQGGSHPSPSGSVTLLEVLLVGLPAALPGPVGLAVSRARQEAWQGAQLLEGSTTTTNKLKGSSIQRDLDSIYTEQKYQRNM
jgi:hypothetical protein